MDRDLITTGFDPSHRELCPDGACIGVIGKDGRCRECGAVSPGGPPAAVEDDVGLGSETSQSGSAKGPSKDPDRSVPQGAVEGDTFDPTKRQLCRDGTCLGVIGADGRCKICGGPPE